MTGLGPLALQAGTETGSVAGSIIVFIINLLIGSIGIHIGAKLIIDKDVGYRRAIVTALIGAIVWAVVAFFFGWIPFLGPLLALIAWIGVINWRYPGGWVAAIAIGLAAWIFAALVLYALGALGLFEFSALGIPGA